MPALSLSRKTLLLAGFAASFAGLSGSRFHASGSLIGSSLAQTPRAASVASLGPAGNPPPVRARGIFPRTCMDEREWVQTERAGSRVLLSRAEERLAECEDLLDSLE
jgi:hypothetical protein